MNEDEKSEYVVEVTTNQEPLNNELNEKFLVETKNEIEND